MLSIYFDIDKLTLIVIIQVLQGRVLLYVFGEIIGCVFLRVRHREKDEFPIEIKTCQSVIKSSVYIKSRGGISFADFYT